MTDASGTTSLTVADVMKLIDEARAAGKDPVTIGIEIFGGLGENIILAGDVLRQALTASAIALNGPLAEVVNGLQSITKTGGLITITNVQELHPVFNNLKVRLSRTITLRAHADPAFSGVTEIVGVAVHKLIWNDITQIQLLQNGTQRVARVVTSLGSREFTLP